MRLVLLVCLVWIAAAGCHTWTNRESNDAPKPRFYSGIQANGALCTECHDPPYEPSHFTDAQWHRFLPKHAKKLKIDDETAQMILDYLTKYN